MGKVVLTKSVFLRFGRLNDLIEFDFDNINLLPDRYVNICIEIKFVHEINEVRDERMD